MILAVRLRVSRPMDGLDSATLPLIGPLMKPYSMSDFHKLMIRKHKFSPRFMSNEEKTSRAMPAVRSKSDDHLNVAKREKTTTIEMWPWPPPE